MRFDTPVERCDGRFAINFCCGMSPRQMLATIWDLSRGRFVCSRRPGTHHWRSGQLTVEADGPFALELDGEVLLAERVTFDVLPHALRCCT